MGVDSKQRTVECRVERREIDGMRRVGKGRTLVRTVKECEFYSKYEETPLKGFKQGSGIIHFIFKKINGCCVEERLEEDEWRFQLKGSSW